MKTARPILAKSIGALLAITALAPLAEAGEIWDGGGPNGLWSTSLNWNLDTLPNFANPLQFDGVLQLFATNDITSGVAGITFNAGAGAFTLSGNAVTLNGGIVNNSANLQTVSFAAITLGSTQTFNANTASLLVTSNVNLSANQLTIDGANYTTLNGVLSGIGLVLKNGAGTLGLGGLNTYSGTTSVSAGIVQSLADGAFSPNSNFTVEGTGILELLGTNNTIQGLNDGGDSTGLVRNNVAIIPAVLTLGNNNASGSYGGLIQDGGAGRLGIRKIGTGTQSFSADNTYTGDTLLEAGALFSNVAPGAGTNTAFGTGRLVISGGTRFGSTVDNQVIPNDISFIDPASPVTIEAATHLDFTGDVDLNAGTRTLVGNRHTAEITFTGVISSTGGGGGLTFNTANLIPPGGGLSAYVAFIFEGVSTHTYTGLTTVNDGAFLVFTTGGQKITGDVLIQGNGVVDYLGGSNQISDTSTVTVNSSGSTIPGGSAFQGFELFNKSDTIGALFGTGTVGLGSGTLTVGAGNFLGIVTNGTKGSGGNFIKNTAGVLTLEGANTYTGATTVTGGRLEVSGSLTSTTINANGGTFAAASSTALLPAAAVTVALGSGFEYRAEANATLTIGSLTLTNGVGKTLGGSIGSTTTGARIIVTGNVTPGPGNIGVNVFGIPGVTTGATGVYTLLQAGAGSNLAATTYSLGTVYNNTNFTVGAPSATATTLTVGITSAAPLAAAYWVGGLPGNPNVWSASNGISMSNWASDNIGTPTPLIPGAGTNVFFSAGPPATPTDPGNMILGADMMIASLSVHAPGAPETRAVTLNRSGGDTLTLATAGGVSIFAGAGAVTLNPDLILGTSQTWTNDSASLYTVNGSVSNGASTLTLTGTGDTLLNGVLGNGAGGLIKNGSGTLTVTNINTYTGDTFLNGGTLFVDVPIEKGATQGLGLGTLHIAGGTTIGSHINNTDRDPNTGLRVEETIQNDLQITGDFTVVAPADTPNPQLNNKHLIFSGDVDLQGGTRTITGATPFGLIGLFGVISNGGIGFSHSGPIGFSSFVIGIGEGTDPANTYTGLTTVNSGVILSLKKVLPGGGIDGAILGDVLVNAGGSLTLIEANQIANTSKVTLHGTGLLDMDGNRFAALEMGSDGGKSETIGSLFGDGTVGLGAAILTVGAGDYSGAIGDGTFGVGGQLTKNTTGTLRLSGANTFTGNTNVNNGTLVLDGSVQSPTLFVNFSGTLMGTGTAFHNVTNAGNFSPGNSAGTFTIGGNYTQTGAGTLTIEIGGTKAGQHDLVKVGGQASLDGNLRIINVGKVRLKVGEKVTFLTAGGGVTGEFANVENDFATGTIITAGVVYDPNSVSLEGQQGSFQEFASLSGLTPNQRAVASALDNIVSDSKLRKLIEFLNDEQLTDLPQDFDLIAPEELASIFTLAVSQANVQTVNLQRRLGEIRLGAIDFSASGLSVSGMMPQESALPPAPADTMPAPTGAAQGPVGTGGKELRAPAKRHFGTFFTGVGEFTHVGETDNASGYDLASGGFTLGADIRIGENIAVGINVGYARSSADLLNNGRVTVDGAKLGVYATYFQENFYVDAAIQGGYNSYDTRRGALQGSATGSTSGGEVNALIAAGYEFHGESLHIGPTASFQYTHTGLGSFRENGSLAPLSYDSQGADSTRTALGMKASYDWRVGGVLVRPEMRAAWQHEFGDVAYAIDSSLSGNGNGAFTVQGAEIGRESLLLGLGVAVLWNERTSTYVYYDGEIGRSNYDSHNVSGGVRLQF